VSTLYATTTGSRHTLSVDAKTGEVVVYKPNLGGSGVTLSESNQKELAFDLLSKFYDLQFYPGDGDERRVNLRPKRKPVRTPEVGEYYRVPGEVGMEAPWCDSPIAKVVTANSPGYIHLETADGATTGWSDIRSLGEPLKVSVQTEWVEDK
jgi:hypothetical protein